MASTLSDGVASVIDVVCIGVAVSETPTGAIDPRALELAPQTGFVAHD